MSSINPHFTFHYSQPDDYRFSHDSVFLARRVFEYLSTGTIQRLRALDLCAGCGIIGLDFLFHCQKEKNISPASMDFLEIQEIYRPHFNTNVRRLGQTSCQINFIQNNYEILSESQWRHHYDLILCNPPYFLGGKGKLSNSDFKNRCRFYQDSTFAALLFGIKNSLALGGAAYVLLRDLPEHRWHVLSEAEKILEGALLLEVLADIRGTHLVKLSHSEPFL